MNNQQLEMTFNSQNRCRRAPRSQQRRSRARWWFSQMRSVVDCAFDWQASPSSRPEQTYLTLARSR